MGFTKKISKSVMGVPEGEEREKVAGRLLREITAKNFPNLY